jgi:hypothetical protein
LKLTNTTKLTKFRFQSIFEKFLKFSDYYNFKLNISYMGL